MSKEWIELMNVTAQIFPEGATLSEHDLALIEGSHWYCSEGNDTADSNVVEGGKAQADITVFNFTFSASCSYAPHIWSEFGFVEYEYAESGDLLQRVFPELAAIAKALLDRCKDAGNHAVRFFVAWEVATEEYRGDYYGVEYETSAELLGWANITKTGMTIIPVDEIVGVPT